MFDKIIEDNKNEIINTVCKLIKFKSVSIETNNPNEPFGKECKNALEYVLNLAASWGFRVKNIDNYCGYIEFGEGNELVGIIGHLDVVPADIDEGWTSDPFLAEVRNNKLYGRGAIDDKGPIIASLFAMKTIFESGKHLNKRVRLILGLNEEKSWKCIKYYKSVGEENPTIGFSPDADFPAIYAEKGIMSIGLKHKFQLENINIIDIDCHNNALNVVPKYCSITLKYITQKDRINFKPQTNINIEKIDNDTIKIISTGKSAHSAHLELGNNAITNLILYLNKYISDEENLITKYQELGLFDITSPKFLSPTSIQDESGILTSNLGYINFDDENLELKFNLRVPVKTTLEEIEEKYKDLNRTFNNIEIKTISKQDPLYIDKDSDLIKMLTSIFNEKTKQNVKPITIGGGTFARAFPNCVAFGPNMPEHKDMCHQVDEYIDIDTLITSTKIYAKAIYELAK